MQDRIDQASGTTWRVACAAASLVLLVAGAGNAEPPPPRNWDLMVNLYGWIPASDLDVAGDIDGGDFSRHYDKDLGDAFGDVDGGGGGDVSFRYGRLVGMFDGAWAQVDENSDGWFTNLVLDGKLGFRVLDLNPPLSSPDASDAHRFTLDLLAGARYRVSETNVDADTRLGVGVRRWHDDWNWVDPVVGVGFSVGLLPNLSFSTVADVGGFDIGNSSHLTWSVNPRLSYRAWDHLNLFLGWKHLQEDHDGNLDLMLSGPQAGIGYAF